ncbi:MAG: hypothetical protein LBG59_05430, partial [Candidatus Peribacteria bacterium]|nr:hypothetical protein [Candidatus Peribacteria bacterium]
AYTACTLYEGMPYEMAFRAGDSVVAYDVAASYECNKHEKKITCKQNGQRNETGYIHINCTP